MSTFFAMRALLFVGEMLVASALIMALASLVSFDNAASRRHLVWLVAFAVLLLLPVLAAFAPSAVRLAMAAPDFPVAPAPNAILTVLPPADSGPAFFSIANLALAVSALWLAGVCMIALRSFAAAIGLRALRRRSVVQDFGDLAGIEPRSTLRISSAEESCGPVTWGFLRPVILLPKSSVFWPRERLELVLRHEMAHVRRHDSLAQTLTLVACALYWPNPLVWLGARAMRRDAEMAADDAVLTAGARPSAYAGELLQLASEYRARRVSPAMAISMAAPSALEARVKSVLAPTQQRSGVTKMDMLKIACAGFLVTTALLLARPSLAQDTPPAASSAAATPSTPPVAVAPPAPPAPAEAPAPATPPAPSTDAMSSDIPAGSNVQVSEDVRTVNGQEIRRVRMIVTKAKRQAREAIARARPEIEKAIAEAKVSEQADQAVKDAQPQIDEAMKDVGPEIDRALAAARAELAKANLDVKIRVRVDEALKRAEVRLQAREAERTESAQKVRSDDSDAQDDK
ncbi:MAG: M56 family metallopeptidase [Rhizomicrobium sp.]